jgi:hypothetical protein
VDIAKYLSVRVSEAQNLTALGERVSWLCLNNGACCKVWLDERLCLNRCLD